MATEWTEFRKTLELTAEDENMIEHERSSITDPFYSESNQAFLRKSLAALNAGMGVEHELIEVEDE